MTVRDRRLMRIYYVILAVGFVAGCILQHYGL